MGFPGVHDSGHSYWLGRAVTVKPLGYVANSIASTDTGVKASTNAAKIAPERTSDGWSFCCLEFEDSFPSLEPCASPCYKPLDGDSYFPRFVATTSVSSQSADPTLRSAGKLVGVAGAESRRVGATALVGAHSTQHGRWAGTGAGECRDRQRFKYSGGSTLQRCRGGASARAVCGAHTRALPVCGRRQALCCCQSPDPRQLT
jgi:hypothetical protein